MVVGKPQHKVLALAVFAALGAMTQAHAQDATPQPATGDEPTTLATMTVTAQKREEAMQDVPIMLTALPEQLLQDTGVRDIKDVQLLVPGLHVIPPPTRRRPLRASVASVPTATTLAWNRRWAWSSTAFIARATAWVSATWGSWNASRC